jgi:hypothetical protein
VSTGSNREFDAIGARKFNSARHIGGVGGTNNDHWIRVEPPIETKARGCILLVHGHYDRAVDA